MVTFLALSTLALSPPTCEQQVVGKVIGFGHDIRSVEKASSAECCSECIANAACVAWTFHVNMSERGACWLHSSSSGSHDEDGVVSAVVSGRSAPWLACTGKAASFPYCDPARSIDERLLDLVGRISDDEAGTQLTARESPALPALGLPSYYWGTNAIHGLQNVGCLSDSLGGKCPTSFPAPCALSAAFEPSLVYAMGRVLGRELRAYYNVKAHDSLDTWSPTINLNRDPRWGRNVESPGEDPHVCGVYGTAYTRGLQEGDDPTIRQATVTLKHWVAYSIESYDGVTVGRSLESLMYKHLS
jgi:hypothetical protein